MANPSNVIDDYSPTANMYGCEPCPKCKGKFRAPYKRGEKLSIECDDCGHKEEGHRKADDEPEPEAV